MEDAPTAADEAPERVTLRLWSDGTLSDERRKPGTRHSDYGAVLDYVRADLLDAADTYREGVWRARFEAQAKDIDAARAENARLESELAEATGRARAMFAEASAFADERDTTRQELTEAKADVRVAHADVQRLAGLQAKVGATLGESPDEDTQSASERVVRELTEARAEVERLERELAEAKDTASGPPLGRRVAQMFMGDDFYIRKDLVDLRICEALEERDEAWRWVEYARAWLVEELDISDARLTMWKRCKDERDTARAQIALLTERIGVMSRAVTGEVGVMVLEGQRVDELRAEVERLREKQAEIAAVLDPLTSIDRRIRELLAK